ncbi:UNVERIFIED_CONTAM: hypothetical protein Sangu_0610100 [Sesamum angustifolium]|uniref:Uncharacterized protein n=1 Tax=Sesamum angustifolium TaxID=2727405 RepID=A0AAW2QBZ9_9LAMI
MAQFSAKRTTIGSQNKANDTPATMVRMSDSMEVVSVEEPELPGAGAGAASLAPMPVVGAPAMELGDTANGERAVADSKQSC